jgi:hypothetical protein
VRTAGSLNLNEFALDGAWEVDRESATARGESALALAFRGRRVFCVLGTDRAPRRVEVLLDGEPIPAPAAGEDAARGRVTVRGQRLYRLVDLPRAGRHTLELRVEPGVSGYAFTFG